MNEAGLIKKTAQYPTTSDERAKDRKEAPKGTGVDQRVQGASGLN